MTSAAPARPGRFAELEELEAARKAGTLAAYDFFWRATQQADTHRKYVKSAMLWRANKYPYQVIISGSLRPVRTLISAKSSAANIIGASASATSCARSPVSGS